jgi:hypothetical protein
MIYSDIVHHLFGSRFPALLPALLRLCPQIIDLSKIYIWNDAVLLLALRYHQHVMRSGQANHDHWTPIPDSVVYQFCRPDKILSSTAATHTWKRRDSSAQHQGSNDGTVSCLNFRKYGEGRFTECKRRHEKTIQPAAGGPQISK